MRFEKKEKKTTRSFDGFRSKFEIIGAGRGGKEG